MTLEEKIGRIFGLDEETWMRHANPWSVWTRNTALPFLVIALWSRVWFGWWSLFPILAALLWIFLNPQLFSSPRTTEQWASRSVLGERMWMNRDTVVVPDHHRIMPHLLNLVSSIGFFWTIWGTYAFDLWSLLIGLILVYMGKLWFLDRMVWLYYDMRHVAEYREWTY